MYSKTASYGTPLGVRDASRTNLWGMDDQTENSNAISWYYGTAVQSSSNTIEKQSKRTVKLSHGKFYLNGTLAYTFTESTFACSNNLYLFGMNEYGTSADTQFVGKIYEVKIFDNTDALIHHYIPCYRKSDNVIGMYDAIGGTFYTNNGSGSFTKGSDALAPSKEIANKKWMNKGVLPSGYQEVEYIESSGTQYINTNVILTLNSAIEVEGIMSANDTTLYGVAENTSYGTSINRESATAISPRWFNGSSATISTTPDSAHVYKQDKTQFYIDGELKQTASTNLSAFTRPLYLMARNNIGSADWIGGRLYYAKIWDNDVLVFNGIPCYRKSDNVIGMYDTVSNTFFANSGTGTFSKGADVLQSGFVFKLNELGMYRLNASNGTVTRSKDVLVDYPVEYILKISYIQYIYQNGTQVVPLRNETSYPFTFNSDSAVWSNNTGDRKGLLGTADKIDLSLFTKLKADVMYSITTEHTYTYVGVGVASALMTSGPVSLAESRATKGTNVRTTLEVDISLLNDDGFVYAHCNRYTGTVSFTIYSMWLE